MGCGVSRIDGLFLRRLEEVKRRHNAPLKERTPSKKELLLHDGDGAASSVYQSTVSRSTPSSPDDSVGRAEKLEGPAHEDPMRPKEEACDKNDQRKNEIVGDEKFDDHKESMTEDEWMDAKEDEDGDDDDDDERMIGHGDFPGSPSFRVYFKNDVKNDPDDSGRTDAFKDAVHIDHEVAPVPFKESPVVEKAKSGRKRRSFRKVLPKGFSMKSCYTTQSAHDRARLLNEKATMA